MNEMHVLGGAARGRGCRVLFFFIDSLYLLFLITGHLNQERGSHNLAISY